MEQIWYDYSDDKHKRLDNSISWGKFHLQHSFRRNKAGKWAKVWNKLLHGLNISSLHDKSQGHQKLPPESLPSLPDLSMRTLPPLITIFITETWLTYQPTRVFFFLQSSWTPPQSRFYIRSTYSSFGFLKLVVTCLLGAFILLFTKCYHLYCFNVFTAMITIQMRRTLSLVGWQLFSALMIVHPPICQTMEWLLRFFLV